jgi:hypothetical protein
MSLNSDLWHQISSVVLRVSDLPQWVLDLAELPMHDVETLSELDHVGDGEVARPHCETKLVTDDYLAFLHRQIQLGARGPEWGEILQARYNALKPYEGRRVINVTFYRKPESVTLRLDEETKALLHVEST